MNLFQSTLKKQNATGVPPIWFMRQAGRYHAHYQNLKNTYSFLDLCHIHDVSAEAAMGPMEDFDFDAAILFSDILFPLQALGVEVAFNPGPQLGRLLQQKSDLAHYNPVPDSDSFFTFQTQALEVLRARLPQEKGLIGFVGGPLTLFMFAVEGTAKGDLKSFRQGIKDGRFEGFMEKLLPILLSNMVQQAEADIDCMAILDSGAGNVEAEWFRQTYQPLLKELTNRFNKISNVPLLYYTLKTTPAHLDGLEDSSIAALGIDHYHDLPAMFERFGERFVLQGNIPPEWMELPEAECEANVLAFLKRMEQVPSKLRQGWICGLGHGMTPQGKEANVKRTVELVREFFGFPLPGRVKREPGSPAIKTGDPG